MAWTIEILNDAVRRELDALAVDVRARVSKIFDVMREHGPQALREPHVKHVHGRLWEIRASGRDGIGRAIYVTARGQRVIVLVAFAKKSQATPKRHLDLALQRMKEIHE